EFRRVLFRSTAPCLELSVHGLNALAGQEVVPNEICVGKALQYLIDMRLNSLATLALFPLLLEPVTLALETGNLLTQFCNLLTKRLQLALGLGLLSLFRRLGQLRHVRTKGLNHGSTEVTESRDFLALQHLVPRRLP